MKKLFTLIVIALFSTATFAQTWTLMQSPPLISYSYFQPVFTIDSLAYFYFVIDDAVNDGAFYAFNSSTNSWSTRASFPGLTRQNPFSFSTGGYGYLGGGTNELLEKRVFDVYQYNPAADTWTVKNNCPDTVFISSSFSIGINGYVIAKSLIVDTYYCYQYNASADQWIKKSNVPLRLSEQFFSTASSANSLYGFEVDEYGELTTTLYEYDPIADTWTQEADMPGGFGSSGLAPGGFFLNNYLYVANSGDELLEIFNPSTNSWSTAPLYNLPRGDTLLYSPGADFTVNGDGYIFQGESLWQYSPGDTFTLSFNSPDSICPGYPFSFTIASNINFSPSNYFKLQFVSASFEGWAGEDQVFTSSDSVFATGPGTYTLHVPYWSTQDNAEYILAQVSVVSSNPVANAVLDTAQLTLKLGPQPVDITPSYTVCVGGNLSFNFNGYASNYYWSDNSGLFDTSSTVVISPLSTTTYYFNETLAGTGCGCTDTFVIYVDTVTTGVPSASYNICPLTYISLGGATVSGYTYSWADGNGFTSSVASPTVSPSVTNVYYLTVTDTSSGCVAYDTVSVFAAIPPAQTICLVTVDSTSSYNIVTWEKLDKDATDSFYIYRETSTNNYSQIGAVQRDSLSVFEDFSANPNLTSYRYKISTDDTCGNTGVLSPYHNTILLQYVGSGELIWNTYDIEDTTTPVATFDVLIDPLGTGVWDTLVSVPGTQSNTQDVNFASHTSAQYRVLANFSYACVPTRSVGGYPVFSNITRQAPAAIDAVQQGRMNIYPNPATNLLYIQYTGRQPDWVTLYDVSGEKLYEAKYNSPQINVANLSAGIYFIEIRTGADSERHRFVKM